MKEFGRAVVAIVEKEGEILIGKKRTDITDPLSNTWHIPGGKNNNGESDENALKREIDEEADLRIRVESLIDESIQQDRGFIVSWYLCHLDGNEQIITPGDDLIEARFVPKKDVFSLCDPKASSLWPQKVRAYLA